MHTGDWLFACTSGVPPRAACFDLGQDDPPCLGL